MADQAVSDYLAKLGRKGAEARNKNMTPAKRKSIAKKAAQARWSKKATPQK